MAALEGDESEWQYKGKAKTPVGITAGEGLKQMYLDIIQGVRRDITMTLKPGLRQQLILQPGHLWGDSEAVGPPDHDVDVMVISKMIPHRGLSQSDVLGDEYRDFLEMQCRKYQLNPKKWYVTSLFKSMHPDGEDGASTLKAKWLNEWTPILAQEIRLVRPKIMLLMGSEVIKAVLGKKSTLTATEGRVLDHAYSYAFPSDPEHVEEQKCQVVCVTSPSAVLRADDVKPQQRFDNSFSHFAELCVGDRERPVYIYSKENLDDIRIDTPAKVKNLLQRIKTECKHNLLGVDGEWNGRHPQNPDAYLRTIQVSWDIGKAAAIKFYTDTGEPVFKPETEEKICKALTKCFKQHTIAGHFLDADIEFLTPFGVDLREHYQASPMGWQQFRNDIKSGKPCGFDTGLAAHALEETASYGLTTQLLCHTDIPRYDMGVLNWITEYCKKNKIKKEDLPGYGPCPDEILIPYGCYDADGTRRLALNQMERLDSDAYGLNCWEPFWTSMRAFQAVMEINMSGILLDPKSLEELTQLFQTKANEILAKIRKWARWPDLNLASTYQIREFVFGTKYNGKTDNEGNSISVRPPGARSLNLRPVLTTDKPAKTWAEVVEKQIEHKASPSAGKSALAIMIFEAHHGQVDVRTKDGSVRKMRKNFQEQLKWVRDWKFMNGALTSSLRPPMRDKKTKELVHDDYGRLKYAKGIPKELCWDGRVRTHIYTTKETGRWSSSRPNMQNLGKVREKDFKRILGDRYLRPTRTIFHAKPGHMIIEADYTGAELFGMAVLSQDQTMLDHALRSQLEESDPRYYDIHSNIAKLAFQLKCAPTKSALAAIGKAYIRNVAKAVIFGVAYGRGAKAIALGAKEEEIDISVDGAQTIIDTIFEQYDRLPVLFADCRARVQDPGWLVNSFGRFRRFPHASDRRMLAKMERQAQNYIIQSLIADAVSRAVDHLYWYRQEHDVEYDIVLQIHDAVLLEVPYEYVGVVVNEVFPECMVKRVPIMPRTLDGFPRGDGPYYLGIDTEIFDQWGISLKPDQLEARGFDPETLAYIGAA